MLAVTRLLCTYGRCTREYALSIDARCAGDAAPLRTWEVLLTTKAMGQSSPYPGAINTLFVTLAFSLLTRWLRDAAAGRPAREWLQLLVPFPAWALLFAALVPFAFLRPVVDPQRGG